MQGTQTADGQFDARTLQRRIHPYANFTGWASYQVALAQGFGDGLRDALPMLKRQVLGEFAALVARLLTRRGNKVGAIETRNHSGIFTARL